MSDVAIVSMLHGYSRQFRTIGSFSATAAGLLVRTTRERATVNVTVQLQRTAEAIVVSLTHRSIRGTGTRAAD